MAVMSSPKQSEPSLDDLIAELRASFPSLTYRTSNRFMWSSSAQVIYYSDHFKDIQVARQQLLHETAHALLQHNAYTYDIELVRIEATAWERAKILGEEFSIDIDEDHVQNCLDTYRNWLYKRSACPSCLQAGLQIDPSTYQCLNCSQTWKIGPERLCRPYRRYSSLKK